MKHGEMSELLREQERIEQRGKELHEFCIVRDMGAGYSLVYAPEKKGVRYRCPCCYYKTLESRGSYEICPVCFWEDDGQDDHGADIVLGGPNHGLSLTEARDNFWKIGACDESIFEFTRPPLPEEW